MKLALEERLPTMNVIVPDKPPTEQQLVQETMERYKVSADFDRPFKDRCLRAWTNLWNQLPMNWPFWSNFFEPETQIATTETVERIMGGLFPKENFCDLRAQHGQTALQTEKTKAYLLHNLRKKANYKLQKYRQATEATSYGNGVAFHFVDMDVVTERKRQPIVDEFGMAHGYQEVAQRRVEFWSKERVISVFDCYPATTGASIQEMPYFIHRELVPLSWLMSPRWEGVLRNVEKLQGFLSVDEKRGHAGLHDEDLAYDLYERLRTVGLNVQEGFAVAKGGGAVEYVELLYETMAPEHPGEPPHVRVIGNRQELLSDGPSLYWHAKKPYSEIKYLERSGNLWRADGLAILMADVQDRINVRSNQNSDAILRNNNPTRIIDRNAGIDDPTLLDPWPGRVLYANNGPTAVTELVRPPADTTLFMDLDMSRATIQRLSKISDVTRSLSGARTGQGRGMDTATGAKLAASMMASAMNFKMLLFEEQGIVDGLRIHLSNIQQAMTQDQRIRLDDDFNPVFAEAGIADGYLTITPLEIQGDYDVTVVGPTDSLEDPEKAALAQAWLERGLADPEVGPWINRMDSWIWIGEHIGVPAPRRFLYSKQEFEQRQAQQLEASLQMARLRAALAPPVVAGPVPALPAGGG